ncbi:MULTISPECIES: GNAT family N-acetyltransferase [Leptospira]|uniref:GNAT family N-acetyltransferase n=1 Tax=Leptospira interrogans serovar Bataviae TaxID=312175 RepID=A0AAQ0B1L0_LEPIR|nr:MULTISPECIES: GNAT family N-acetyltransferase [Leptospira]EKP04857.1 acetyltransferase (GNAT) domain protein [Leptospira kirschneri str. 2008720114]EKR24630.1 acetyltransferase (GNAT) domain protein [Leptospira interrogans serovar Bataviae str. L1111]MCR8647623.1 GNAT family N-acetyltransferase [Leptospira interrogans serovar Bataviae]OAM73281.1 GNAT family acetyltransferase [Leptospira interrogans serovar Bataviae]QOI38183.1 GNAT family N-acetyltransferase [Leptospira interrogans serovar B
MFSLRLAQDDDLELLFQWANDPLVRQMAFHSEPISLSDHKNWFYFRLNALETKIFILEENKIPIGQIRFDLDKTKSFYYIDYSIDEKYRGKGIGKKILILGIEFHKPFNNGRLFYRAFVKKNNQTSIKCFINVGFTFCSEDSDCMIFELSNEVDWNQ